MALRSRHNGMFWCTTQAHGCGDQLLLAAGPIVRPYFRHRAGSDCALIGQRAAGPAYEHLQYQLALQQWLAKQGHQAELEKRLGPDGRTDLHVVIDGVSHILEVQLSPIGTAQWKSRDENYRRRADHVTWLYGPFAEAAAASELAVRGFSLTLRRGPEVGVRDVADAVYWVALDACRLTTDGFFAPGIEEAKELFDGERQSNAAESHRPQVKLGSNRDGSSSTAERRLRHQSTLPREVWTTGRPRTPRRAPGSRSQAGAGSTFYPTNCTVPPELRPTRHRYSWPTRR